MRIKRITFQNIGGIHDGSVVLPTTNVAALAGPNGTGKSKFLACLLTPWTHLIPPPALDQPASITLQLEVSGAESLALLEFSKAKGWGTAAIPEEFTFIATHDPLAGPRFTSEPHGAVLTTFGRQADFLSRHPSMDALYIPAERRLLNPGQTMIDLTLLSESRSQEFAHSSKSSAQDQGILDDQEFESFARALSVASFLPSDPTSSSESVPIIQWEDFANNVNALIAPKQLLPLTRENPDQLRIKTADGTTHPVKDLSSGERQALIVMSRVLRAGQGRQVMLIDEPDAYLHPNLSRRLAISLEESVGTSGQLILASHSPAVLDTVAPSSTIRMSHDASPIAISDESERLQVYRNAGFRASALTQSDLLLVCEGDSDAIILPLVIPDLSRASVRAVGGRNSVLQDVARLAPFDLPVLGVIDRDLSHAEVARSNSRNIIEWPKPDIEGVFLADDASLEIMMERGFAKKAIRSTAHLREILSDLYDAQRDNFVAEHAQITLKAKATMQWPSPKGVDPISRLRASVQAFTLPANSDLEHAIESAKTAWEKETEKSKLVRGKYVLAQFNDQCSTLESGQALLEALARARPVLAGLQEFRTKLDEVLRRPEVDL